MVVPVPFAATTSYGGGAEEGPAAVLRALRDLRVTVSSDAELDALTDRVIREAIDDDVSEAPEEAPKALPPAK